jgi:hypothetical protein
MLRSRRETIMSGTPAMHVRTLMAAVALAAALVLPASAQVERSKLTFAKNATESFVRLAQGSEKSGNAPRQSDPAVKQLLDAAFDTSDVEAAKAIPFSELSQLSERMVTGVRIGVVYMLAGTGATEIGQLGNDPNAGEKVNLNVIKFAPEMGRFFDFQMRIQGAVIDAVLARLATAKAEDLARPNFKSGLADIRDGSARSVSGVVETLAVNGITEEWRRERLPALTAIAPKLAKFLESTQKNDLRQLALACADVMDDAQVKAGLQDFAKAIAGT